MVPFHLLVCVAATVAGLPLHELQSQSPDLKEKSWLGPQLPVTSPIQQLSLPNEDIDPYSRRREVEVKRTGFLYGPSLLGNSSYFPTGVLGNAMVQQHQDQWYEDAAWLVETAGEEAAAAMAAIQDVGILQPQSFWF